MADTMTPEQRSRCMAAIKGKDTKPEMIVRKYLFSRGLRYRVNNRKLPGSPDIVLKKYKTVIFVDGCFWHAHRGCKYYRLPKSNVDFWRAKIARNIARDYVNNVDLELAGWKVIRVWECEIRAVRGREEYLDKLYEKIVKPVSKPLPYSIPEEEDYDVAAEPEGEL
ncbi:MAG: very short patch repair endonuclease [Muribaculaceae bacterium]|nr:very short patch repair endonuclease [Muribaculaceae bacterium]